MNAGRISRDDPQKQLLQFQCYQLRVVEKLTYQEIAVRMKLDRATVSEYVGLEGERRTAERSQQRNAEIDRALDTCDTIERIYTDRMNGNSAKGDEARYILAAQEQRAKLLGLMEPIRIKDETVYANPLEGLSPAEQLAFLRKLPDALPGG